MAVLVTVLATALRVLAGLTLAAVCSLVVGVAVRFWNLFGNLTLPTIRLLAPVSPIAWLPMAIFVFGIGNAPAIFMVFIALFSS
jgi:NitT/TauT family transport system permease protein